MTEQNGLTLPIEKPVEVKIMPINQAKAQLYKKMLVTGEEIGAMSKDVSVSFSGAKYDAIGYENLNSILKVLLRKNNLALIPSVAKCDISKFVAKKSNGIEGNYNAVALTLEIEIIDTETGYSETKNSFAYVEGTDDKTVAKAITEAFKRWEFKAFHVTSMDSPDLEESAPPYSDEIDLPKPKKEANQEPKQLPKQEEPKEFTTLATDLIALVKDKKMSKLAIEAVFKDWNIKETKDVPKGKEKQFYNDCLNKFSEMSK